MYYEALLRKGECVYVHARACVQECTLVQYVNGKEHGFTLNMSSQHIVLCYCLVLQKNETKCYTHMHTCVKLLLCVEAISFRLIEDTRSKGS